MTQQMKKAATRKKRRRPGESGMEVHFPRSRVMGTTRGDERVGSARVSSGKSDRAKTGSPES